MLWFDEHIKFVGERDGECKSIVATDAVVSSTYGSSQHADALIHALLKVKRLPERLAYLFPLCVVEWLNHVEKLLSENH